MSDELESAEPSPDVLWRELDGQVVLLDVAGEHYYMLDEVGTRIWRLLDEHHDVEAVVAGLLDEFEVDEATVRADVAELLGRLRESGLIVAPR
jgi:Coenzyme PQQ synthesis protein D (PqqD)